MGLTFGAVIPGCINGLYFDCDKLGQAAAIGQSCENPIDVVASCPASAREAEFPPPVLAKHGNACLSCFGNGLLCLLTWIEVTLLFECHCSNIFKNLIVVGIKADWTTDDRARLHGLQGTGTADSTIVQGLLTCTSEKGASKLRTGTFCIRRRISRSIAEKLNDSASHALSLQDRVLRDWLQGVLGGAAL